MISLDAEVKRLIIKEIHRQMNIITGGAAGTNTNTTQDIDSYMPGHPPIPARPFMHPYGHVSRAPRGTICVTAQQGEHPGNKLTLGHRDPNAPAVEVGETAVYSLGKYTVKVSNEKLELGKDGEYETMVVGDTLKEFLVALLEILVRHRHIVTAPGAPSGPPIEATEFTDLNTNYLTNDKILAKDGGRF